MQNIIINSGRAYHIRQVILFKNNLKIMTGIDDIPRAIAESNFRIMFSPERDRIKLFVFATFYGTISISMIGMSIKQVMELA